MPPYCTTVISVMGKTNIASRNPTFMNKGEKLLGSFVGGIAFTLLLLLVVPEFCDKVVKPFVENNLAGTTFIWFTTSMIVSGVMLIITLLFLLIFGGGGIMRLFGVTGVIGLIVGYYLIGKPNDAIIPVGTMVIFMCLSVVRKKKKKKKEEARQREAGR